MTSECIDVKEFTIGMLPRHRLVPCPGTNLYIEVPPWIACEGRPCNSPPPQSQPKLKRLGPRAGNCLAIAADSRTVATIGQGHKQKAPWPNEGSKQNDALPRSCLHRLHRVRGKDCNKKPGEPQASPMLGVCLHVSRLNAKATVSSIRYIVKKT